jgi:hypothetical protein
MNTLVQAMQSVQAAAPPACEPQDGVQKPLVSCYECDTVWHSIECARCPRCSRQIGYHYLLNQEQTYELLTAVSLLNKERIARASEYETWSFGEILRKNVMWYDANCRRTIQACYEVLCEQKIRTKTMFAINFFEQAYLLAPEDKMMHHFDDKEDDYYCSDLDDW